MRSTFAFGTILAAALTAAAPGLALQTVMLPQAPGDSTSNLQNPNTTSQDQFGTQESNSPSGDLGAFHFHMSSGSDWPGDPYRFEHQPGTTPNAYGNAATPGSEFSTSNLFYPH